MKSLKQIAKSMVGFLRLKMARVKPPKNTYIGKGTHIVNGKCLTIEENVSIRPYVDLFVSIDGGVIGAGTDIGIRTRIDGKFHIGKNVLMGPDNYISLYNHTYEDIHVPIINQGVYKPNKNNHDDICIGDGTWIGTHCAIIGDVHIGKNCVIGANSVVTHDVPDYCVVVGAPARIVKRYNFESGKWERVD